MKNITQTIPQIAKDKQGFNVNILILQYLHELQTGDLDLLQCWVERLKK